MSGFSFGVASLGTATYEECDGNPPERRAHPDPSAMMDSKQAKCASERRIERRRDALSSTYQCGHRFSRREDLTGTHLKGGPPSRIMPGILIRFGRFVTHLTFCVFILVLPVGYYPSDSTHTDMIIGVHGDIGQVASVMRDCSGKAISSSENSFKDIAASAAVTSSFGNRSFMQFGMRGGHWQINNPRLVDLPFPMAGTFPDLSDTYMNPFFSVEGRKIGIGFGYLSGRVPWSLSDFESIENASDPMFTGHFRIGELDRPHFLTQLGESSPLTSAGLLTIGYGLGGKHYYYAAFSAGYYDRPGFYYLTRLSLTDHTILDLSGRVGGAAGHFEGAFAVGLNYRFNMGRKK